MLKAAHVADEEEESQMISEVYMLEVDFGGSSSEEEGEPSETSQWPPAVSTSEEGGEPSETSLWQPGWLPANMMDLELAERRGEPHTGVRNRPTTWDPGGYRERPGPEIQE